MTRQKQQEDSAEKQEIVIGESNVSPEIPDRGRIPDIPGLPLLLLQSDLLHHTEDYVTVRGCAARGKNSYKQTNLEF